MKFIHGLHLPSKLPTNWVLKTIAFPPPKSYFLPSTINGKVVPPRISYRNQARLARACAMANIDPLSIGLPELKQKEQEIQLENKALVKSILDRVEKRRGIEVKMDGMKDRLEKWREEKKSIKNKQRAIVPF